MRLHWVFAPVIIASCQSGIPDVPDPIALGREAEAVVYQPILISREDTLTVGTREQIKAHNNTYWCRHPDQLPEGAEPPTCP